MKNKLKQILEAGKPAIGSWIGFSDPYSVELMADIGFDWLLIDMEHFPLGKANLRTILMALKGSESVPVVRVAAASPEHFQAALDLGAQGVMAPMVSSAADAARVVEYCRYPPQGRRGLGPVRASHYLKELKEYRKHANSEIALFVQIETPEAVSKSSEIFRSPGIDGVFIGNGDLANFFHGHTDSNTPEVQATVDELIEVGKAASVPVGLPTWSPQEFGSYTRKGAQLLTLGSDLHFLSSQAKADLSQARQASGRQP
jgi:4-hydroxy-2-oxoheptanedioate aldolase